MKFINNRYNEYLKYKKEILKKHNFIKDYEKEMELQPILKATMGQPLDLWSSNETSMFI
jgi:hypothetical protein